MLDRVHIFGRYCAYPTRRVRNREREIGRDREKPKLRERESENGQP